MRKLFTILTVAVMAAAVFSSCEKEKENPILNPAGTPVKFTFTATATSETEADLKVVADTPVPADVTIALAAAEGNTMTGMTFPSELVIAKGTTEATGKLTVDKASLTPEVEYKAVIAASLAGTVFGTATVFTITVPKPAPVTVDGDVTEWAKLPGDYVTELTCAGDAELAGIKSAKVFYDEKLYVLLEMTDEAIAKGQTDGKLRVHFYFDADNSKADGYYHKWSQPAIDYMLEGKLYSGTDWCAISSAYQKYTGTDPNVWSGSWTAEEASPSFTFAGKDNYYECAMDYSNFPGGLGNVIGMGFDIQDADYNIVGYLPSAGPLAQVVKNGEEIPAVPGVEIAIDGDFSEWKSVESIAGDGALQTLKMQQTADKIYFYAEVVKTEDIKLDETMAFAHKLMLCFDNGDNQGTCCDGAWGGARYDKTVDIWLMQAGVPNMANEDLEGFEHKEADGDIQKYEFGFNKTDAIFKGDCLCYGAYINNQTVDTSTGSLVWEGEGTTRLGSAPATGDLMAVVGTLPEPELPVITIDGDLSDWANVTAEVSQADGVMQVIKATYDAEYIYVYNKRTWHNGLWKEDSGGYIYYEFDTDNNAGTHVVDVNGNDPAGGTDAWMYLYLFTGSSDAPTFAAAPLGSGSSETILTNVIANGATDKTIIETEVRIPRANIGVNKGDVVKVYSWGNKSSSNLKKQGIPMRLAK